jgi:hypothetical protein
MIFVAAALVLTLAQAGVQSFAGTWTTELKGDTYIRLELRETHGALSGQISLGTIHPDKDGVVDTVIEPATYSKPIFDVALRDGVLSFARTDEGDTDRFELRVVGDRVELTYRFHPGVVEALKRDGITPVRPVLLSRSPR